MGKLNMRTRDVYRYSKKDLLDLRMLKMEADLEIFKYLSELDEFSEKKIIYEPGSELIVNGKKKVIDSYFVDYAQIMLVICGVLGKINRVEPYRCPYNEKYCQALLKNMGRGRPALEQERIETIKELFSQGQGIRAIARLVGVAPSVVYKYVREKGVKQ